MIVAIATLLELLGSSVSAQLAGLVFEPLKEPMRDAMSTVGINDKLDKAIRDGAKRFVDLYAANDDQISQQLVRHEDFWRQKDFRKSVREVLKRPSAYLPKERQIILQYFASLYSEGEASGKTIEAIRAFFECVKAELTSSIVDPVARLYKEYFDSLRTDARTRPFFVDTQPYLLIVEGRVNQGIPATYCLDNLPQLDRRRFIGRQDEQLWLIEQLRRECPARQIAIVGFSGVGKSALALKIAWKYKEEYSTLAPEDRFDSIIWVSAKEVELTVDGPRQVRYVANRHVRTLDDIYSAMAITWKRLDIIQTPPETRHGLLVEALRAQRTLLIVDNFEGVADPDEMRAFLDDLPFPTKILITSRNWYDSSTRLELSGLQDDEIEHLIENELEERRLTHGLDALQKRQLAVMTGRLPLVVTLSIARLDGHESFENVIEWLANASSDVADYCVKSQTTMVRQNDKTAWNVFMAFATLDRNAGATKEALKHVAMLTDTAVDQGLARLRRLSLVERAGSGRYWLLPIIYSYCSASAREDLATWELLNSNFVDYYLEFASRTLVRRAPAERYWNTLWVTNKLQVIDPEWSNLLGALEAAEKSDQPGKLLELLILLIHYMDRRGLFEERIRFATEAAQIAAGRGSIVDEGLLRIDALGWTYCEQAKPEKSLDEIAAGLSVVRSLPPDDPDRNDLEALAFAFQARAYAQPGEKCDLDVAHRRIAAAKQLIVRPVIASRVCMIAGDLAQRSGNNDLAIDEYGKSIYHSSQYGGEGADAETRWRLGQAFLDKNPDKAEQEFKRVIAVHEAALGPLIASPTPELLRARFGLAQVARKRQHYEEARQIATEVRRDVARFMPTSSLLIDIQNFLDGLPE